MDQGTNLILPRDAISLWQPYAWLVVNGHKTIENRKQRFAFRGPVWIQASKMKSVDVWQKVRALCDEFLGKDFELPALDELELGAIIGRVTITGVIHPLGGLFSPKTPVPWHFPDQYGLICEGAVPLETPVKCRGLQSFPFRVPDDVWDELRRAAA